MFSIFIWQNQCEANPSTQLIGSFSVGILENGNGPSRVFLFLSKAGKFKIGSQTAIKILSLLTAKLPEKAKKIETSPRFQWRMKKTNILRRVLLSWGSGNFWNRNWNRYHQKTINDFINQQKIEILFFIVPKVDKVTTTFGLNTFQYLSISSWNSLSDETRSAPDLNTFKRCIKQLTFKKWLHI